MMTTDDDDYTELETRRRTTRKSLALFGLVFVGGLLLYKCASQADRFGLGASSPGPSAKASPELEITIDRDGRIQTRGCTQGTVEDCVAQAKVRARSGDASSRVVIQVEPGAPTPRVREIEALVHSFELTPATE